MHPDHPTPAHKDCILFATADWDTPYWTNKQHTADHLAKAGWRVLYVESIGLRAPKLHSGIDLGRLFRRLKRGLAGPKPVAPNIWALSPLVIPAGHHLPWIRAFNQGFLAWQVRRFMRRQGFKAPMVWSYHPYVIETVERIQIKRGALVYHCVDDISSIPNIDAKAFLAEEARFLHLADVVFTTNETLAEKCQRHNANVHNFPNVVDMAHFAQALVPGEIPHDLKAIPEPRLAYIGVLSDFKVDFTLLTQVATAHPEWQIVLIGEEREGQQSAALHALVKLPNVHQLGYKPYAQLPNYLRGVQVGLLPTLVNDYTHGMFPMKYFEYLAAGVPVASTPLAFTSTHSAGIVVGANANAFSAAVEQQLNDGRLDASQSQQLIGANTWEQRLNKMLSIISLAKSAQQ